MGRVTGCVARSFRISSRAPIVIALAVTVGTISALLVLVPQIRSFEQNLGLEWLFRLRGPVAGPEEVVLVTISRESATNIFLPRDPEKFHRCVDIRTGIRPDTHSSLPSMPARWPRCLHAMLIDKLVQAGASTIAFDVLFRTRPPLPGSAGDLNAEQDQLLGAAMTRARRVLIAGKLEAPALQAAGDTEELTEISRVVLDGALGMAPFPVTDRREGRFDEFVAFTDGGSATPSLPALAIQAYSFDVYPQFRGMLAKLAPDHAQLLPATADEIRSRGQMQATCLLIRQLFAGDPELAARMQSELASADYAELDTTVRTRIARLIALHSGPGTRMLNLFGPPGAIHAFGYDKVLAFNESQAETAFRGKMVLVGYAEIHVPEQMEHFPTVFSSADGVALSGTEIAATAFANLLNDSSIRPAGLPLWMLITMLAGTLSALLCLILPNRLAFPIVGLLLGGYAWTALRVFVGSTFWLPLAIPACIATPLGLATGIAWKYMTARQQRDYFREAFRKFVPKEVVEELERNAGNFSATRESLECACVATDAANFTSLAEAMRSEDLADYLNRYFDMLFRPVARHGGFVSDIVGDAMLAIWPNRSANTREHMLKALLEMQEAAREFNEQPTPTRLMTRFGVDWGRVTLTMVGSQTHYEYRAVGDTVNTASRIQELNKKLGTRVLVSSSALNGAAGQFLVRDAGLFLLRGKTLPVHVSELVGLRENATRDQLDLCRSFAAGTDLLRAGNKADALTAFRTTLAEFPQDQATAFYVQRLESGAALVKGALKLE